MNTPIVVPDVMFVSVPGGERVAIAKGDRLSLFVSHETPGTDSVRYSVRVNAPVQKITLWARFAFRMRRLFGR